MSFALNQPAWMLGVLIVLPLAIVAFFTFVAMGRVRRWAAIFLRAGFVALLCAMLAGASSIRRTDKLAVVAVVDISASVRTFVPAITLEPASPATSATLSAPLAPLDAVRAWLDRAAGSRGPEDLLAVVLFDGSAIAVEAPTPGIGSRSGGPTLRPFDARIAEGTDLAAAIRLAASIIPPEARGRMVLFSDGVETRENALAAAREIAGVSDDAGQTSTKRAKAGAASIPIDVVPLNYNLTREVIAESLDVPPRAPFGAPINVRVTLRSTGPARGTLSILDENEPLDLGGGKKAVPVELAPGLTVTTLTVRPPSGRTHKLAAVFEPAPPDAGEAPADTVAANNRAEAFTITPAAGSVLIIDGGTPDAKQPLAAVLRDEGLEVDVVAPEAVPTDLLRLQAYDLVIVQNAPAEALGTESQSRLVQYVTEMGGGLVMVGGPDAYAAGGYRGGPLEPILPLKLDLPDKLVMPAAAVMLVIDCSNSMAWNVSGSGRSQQDVANEGAAAAARSLSKFDLLGCIAFNTDYEEIFPLDKNTDPEANARKILSIYPHGGTNLPPALSEAYRQMRSVEAKSKHVIVLSDGVSMGKERIPGMVKAMVKDGIRVSTIAVGDGADADGMEAMAADGGGEYYRVTDPRSLPRIFMKAIRVVRAPLVREVPFVPIVLAPASPLLMGLAQVGEMPPLGGLTLTQAREEPTITLALVSAEGEPVLSHWQAGLGQVACFTSDSQRWASSWIGWPGYRRFWSQVARTISRAGPQRGTELSTEIVGDELRIKLEARDDAGKPIDGLDVAGAVFAPGIRAASNSAAGPLVAGDAKAAIRLAQTGPGVYEARVPAADSGHYVVTLAPKRGGRALTPIVGGATQSMGIEFRSLTSNEPYLRTLAEVTGGRVLSITRPPAPGSSGPASNLFDRTGLLPRESRSPLWPILLAWAIAIFLLDIGSRRVAWDRLFSGNLAQAARRAVRDRSAQAAGTLSGLRKRGVQVEEQVEQFQGTALSGDEAHQVAQAAKIRRRAERAARQTADPAFTPVNAPSAPSQPPAVIDDRASPQSETTAPDTEPGGLLAAKRRAQDRFKE